MKATLELVFSGAGLVVSAFAVTLTLILWWRDRYRFRGSDLTLANQNDEQHAMSLSYATHPTTTRDLFPTYDDRGNCALVRAVWLNTGDRATFVFVKRALASTRLGTFRCLHYSYVDVPAGATTLQPMLIGG